MMVKYVSLACFVPEMEIKRFAPVLIRLKSIDQLDPQFTPENSKSFYFQIQTTLNNDLNKISESFSFMYKKTK